MMGMDGGVGISSCNEIFVVCICFRLKRCMQCYVRGILYVFV